MQIYHATMYIRLSYTDDRGNESDSVGNQRKLIEDFVRQNPEIEIVSEKIDDGYSGVIFDRPAFNEMMRDVEDGKINCVIVKDLSRLGREYIETGRFLRRVFPAYGVRFIAINDNIDTAKDMNGDDLAVSVKNIMNEAYSRDISIKTRSSLETKRKNGDFVGAFAVYGYRKSEENKNRLVIDEYAAAVVKDIFRMRLEGVSAAKIAEGLNRQGIPSPIAYKKEQGLPYAKGGYADKEGAKWSATTIIRILKDETYTGTLIQGKKGTPNYKMKQVLEKPEEEWLRVENAHDWIIPRHDFDLVKRIKNLDTRTAPGSDRVYLFSGILICGCCGSRMTRKTVPYKDKQYYYYYCPSGKKRGCHMPAIKEAELTGCALGIVKSHIDNVASLEAMLSGIDQDRLNREQVKRYTGRIGSSEKRLEQINGFKASLYENLVGGVLSKEEFLTLKNKYSDEARQVGETIANLQRDLDDVMENRSGKNQWMEHFKRFSSMEELDRKAVIQLIQSICIIDKNNIEISFNYQSEFDKAMSMLAVRERRAG